MKDFNKSASIVKFYLKWCDGMNDHEIGMDNNLVDMLRCYLWCFVNVITNVLLMSQPKFHTLSEFLTGISHEGKSLEKL